jgi:hypothetical protein
MDVYWAVEDPKDEVRSALVQTSTPDPAAAIAALAELRRVVGEQQPKLEG